MLQELLISPQHHIAMSQWSCSSLLYKPQLKPPAPTYLQGLQSDYFKEVKLCALWESLMSKCPASRTKTIRVKFWFSEAKLASRKTWCIFSFFSLPFEVKYLWGTFWTLENVDVWQKEKQLELHNWILPGKGKGVETNLPYPKHQLGSSPASKCGP